MTNFTETELGNFIELNGFLIFFGKKNSSIENLKAAFPNLNFTRLKQTHGNEIVASNPGEDLLYSADAQISSHKSHAACVITADCIPILIANFSTGSVAAIHAGWRGVVNRICPKTLELLKQQSKLDPNCRIFIGPHIRQESFEVGTDVKNQILASANRSELTADLASGFEQIGTSDKWRVDLYPIVRQQLADAGIRPEQIFFFERNTMVDTNYHSHRRDKESSGRQISFIARLR